MRNKGGSPFFAKCELIEPVFFNLSFIYNRTGRRVTFQLFDRVIVVAEVLEMEIDLRNPFWNTLLDNWKFVNSRARPSLNYRGQLVKFVDVLLLSLFSKAHMSFLLLNDRSTHIQWRMHLRLQLYNILTSILHLPIIKNFLSVFQASSNWTLLIESSRRSKHFLRIVSSMTLYK